MKYSEKRSAFSLVEVIISLAILSIITLLVFEIMTQVRLNTFAASEIGEMDMTVSHLMAGTMSGKADEDHLPATLDEWSHQVVRESLARNDESELVQMTLTLQHKRTGESHSFVQIVTQDSYAET